MVTDPDLLVKILNMIREKPRIALRFFRWIQWQSEVKRSELAFCAVLEILVENNLMRSAYWIMERVVLADMCGIADVLIGKHLNSDISTNLLDLLLWIYTKKSMLEQCLSVFDKMLRNGLLPNVKNCNRILRMLRDKNLIEKAREVYRAMEEYGIKPTIVTYNTMLDSFCKEGEVRQALDLVLEMQRRGCLPNDVTYNILINGLSKKGKLEEAKDLFTK